MVRTSVSVNNLQDEHELHRCRLSLVANGGHGVVNSGISIVGSVVNGVVMNLLKDSL